jgi:biotin-(acetyl-CoA carboxylase) ligase
MDLPGQALMFSCGFACQSQNASSLSALGPALGVSSVLALEGFLRNRQALQVKWPNDLMLGSGKVAGILAQTTIQGENMHLVIGMGLNLIGQTRLTRELDRDVAAIAAYLQPETQAQDLVCALALSWQTTIKTLTDQGFSAYHGLYAERDYLAGHAVEVTHQGQLVAHGQARGLDERGRLLVLTDHGLALFDVGDVSVRLDTA